MGLKSTSEISPSYPEVGRDEDLDDENDEDDVGGPHANCDVYAHRPLQAVGGNTHGLDGGERRFFARVIEGSLSLLRKIRVISNLHDY